MHWAHKGEQGALREAPLRFVHTHIVGDGALDVPLGWLDVMGTEYFIRRAGASPRPTVVYGVQKVDNCARLIRENDGRFVKRPYKFALGLFLCAIPWQKVPQFFILQFSFLILH